MMGQRRRLLYDRSSFSQGLLELSYLLPQLADALMASVFRRLELIPLLRHLQLELQNVGQEENDEDEENGAYNGLRGCVGGHVPPKT